MVKRINKLFRNLKHIKSNDTHRFLDLTSCHPYHCKKSIPCNQALSYNRICSDNRKFDQRCNNLKKWLKKRDYSERSLRTHILKARTESWDSLLEQGNTRISESKLTFNITSNKRFTMSEAYDRNFKFC